MNDDICSELELLTYSYPQYGIFLSVPVFKDTGPLISITDPPHAQKTCCNQPQYGTHASSLGCGYIVNRSLVDLQHLGDHKVGLLSRDVDNVDKQDDGAACCLFHVKALKAMTEGEGDSIQIIDHFRGLFVYLFNVGGYLLIKCVLKLRARLSLWRVAQPVCYCSTTSSCCSPCLIFSPPMV